MASLSDALVVMSSGMRGANLRAVGADPDTSAVLLLPSAATPAALWLTNRRGRSACPAGSSEGSAAGEDMQMKIPRTTSAAFSICRTRFSTTRARMVATRLLQQPPTTTAVLRAQASSEAVMRTWMYAFLCLE